jgi:hypothetical protein
MGAKWVQWVRVLTGGQMAVSTQKATPWRLPERCFFVT